MYVRDVTNHCSWLTTGELLGCSEYNAKSPPKSAQRTSNNQFYLLGAGIILSK